MNVIDKWIDSYRHYRRHVALGRLHAIYRAFYYSIKKREPYA